MYSANKTTLFMKIYRFVGTGRFEMRPRKHFWSTRDWKKCFRERVVVLALSQVVDCVFHHPSINWSGLLEREQI